MPLAIKMDITPSPAAQMEGLRGRLGLVRQAIVAQLDEVIMPHVVQRSRLNAPVLAGDLRASIRYQRPRLKSGGEIVTGIGSTLPYALRWHEEEFNLGPVSRVQPNTPEGGVGNKYISRVINYHRSAYRESLRRAVSRTLTSGIVITVPLGE